MLCYEGISITDPNMDETGRFPVDWRTYWMGDTMAQQKQMVVARYPVGHEDEGEIIRRLTEAGIPHERREYTRELPGFHLVGERYVMIVVTGARCMEAFDLVNTEE